MSNGAETIKNRLKEIASKLEAIKLGIEVDINFADHPYFKQMFLSDDEIGKLKIENGNLYKELDKYSKSIRGSSVKIHKWDDEINPDNALFGALEKLASEEEKSKNSNTKNNSTKSKSASEEPENSSNMDIDEYKLDNSYHKNNDSSSSIDSIELANMLLKNRVSYAPKLFSKIKQHGKSKRDKNNKQNSRSGNNSPELE